MSEKIRVAIVDDHPLFREGVASILRVDPDFEVVGDGAAAADAIRLANDFKPDLILLDVDMPGGGIDAAQFIARQYPTTRVVFLTVSEEDDNLVKALRSGARGYILKGISSRELVRILKTIHAGERYVPPALAASLLVEMSSPSSLPRDPVDDLTGRERQILEKLAGGLSNKEIGQQLFLSEKTVKHYMTNILQKLQVHNRVEAALIAQTNENKKK